MKFLKRLYRLLQHDNATAILYSSFDYILDRPSDEVDVKAAIILWQAIGDMIEARNNL